MKKGKKFRTNAQINLCHSVIQINYLKAICPLEESYHYLTQKMCNIAIFQNLTVTTRIPSKQKNLINYKFIKGKNETLDFKNSIYDYH